MWEYAKIYEAIITSAKIIFCNNRVEAMSSQSEVFKLMLSANSGSKRSLSPLFYWMVRKEAFIAAKALQENLPAQYEDSIDLLTILNNEGARILSAEELTEPDIRSCTNNSSDTCAGTYGRHSIFTQLYQSTSL